MGRRETDYPRLVEPGRVRRHCDQPADRLRDGRTRPVVLLRLPWFRYKGKANKNHVTR